MSRTLEELDRDKFVAEAESLAQIVAHPSWARFEELLTQMRLTALEQMARASRDDFTFWQGAVFVLQEIKDRPRQIVSAARSMLEAEDQVKRQGDRRALDFVTPFDAPDDL